MIVRFWPHQSLRVCLGDVYGCVCDSPVLAVWRSLRCHGWSEVILANSLAFAYTNGYLGGSNIWRVDTEDLLWARSVASKTPPQPPSHWRPTFLDLQKPPRQIMVFAWGILTEPLQEKPSFLQTMVMISPSTYGTANITIDQQRRRRKSKKTPAPKKPKLRLNSHNIFRDCFLWKILDKRARERTWLEVFSHHLIEIERGHK